MIAETLAGIALVKQSVSFIKDQIDTCKDIGDIAGAIDKMFEGEQQIQKKRNKRSGFSDPFNTGNIARETIDAKLAQEQMQEIASLINMRFGPGTWQGIIAERAKRIQEAKEAELERRKEKARQQKELMEGVKLFGMIILFTVIAVGIIGASVFYVNL